MFHISSRLLWEYRCIQHLARFVAVVPGSPVDLGGGRGVIFFFFLMLIPGSVLKTKDQSKPLISRTFTAIRGN